MAESLINYAALPQKRPDRSIYLQVEALRHGNSRCEELVLDRHRHAPIGPSEPVTSRRSVYDLIFNR